MRPADLSRWNRAGLSRFRYVDGNAITWLERLRQAMAEAFEQSGGEPQWRELVERLPAPPGESAEQWRERLLTQYHDERRDYGWEILRALARSAHVLTEHLDRFANESFIGTAREWENLRRLVSMLDYQPAPPASASAGFALEVSRAAGIPIGFALRHTPRDGAPLIFETLSELQADPALNLLRAAGWNRNPEAFRYSPVAGEYRAAFELETDVKPPPAGSVALLQVGGRSANPGAIAVRVAGVNGQRLELSGESPPAGLFPAPLWQVSLLVGAESLVTPLPTGPDVVKLDRVASLVAGRSAVAWQDAGSWRAARVERVNGQRIELSANQLPASGVSLYPLSVAGSQPVGEGQRIILPLNRKTRRVWRDNLQPLDNLSIQKADGVDLYEYRSGGGSLHYLDQDAPMVARVAAADEQTIRLPGAQKKLDSGDWIIHESADETLQACRIQRVTPGDGDTAITLDPAAAHIGRLHMRFARSLRPAGHDHNTQPLFDVTQRSESHSSIRLELEGSGWPQALTRGRKLILSDGQQAIQCEIEAIDRETASLRVTPALPGSRPGDSNAGVALRRHQTRIHANVVTAGHGETRPPATLGSGDATRSNQQFELAADAVSFVRDTGMPAGVRSALELEVDGRRWKQVANLRHSEPGDHHYCVRMNESGRLILAFGDGRHGRRLPTGGNNLRVTYRKGVGQKGNLPAHSRFRAVAHPDLVTAVLQPIATTGGAEMESGDSLREHAPASTLTLQRAVSLSDFRYLAQQHASVWQAQAQPQISGGRRGERIAVTIVPAGGTATPALLSSLQDYLSSHALPTVSISVSAFEPLYLELDIGLQIETEGHTVEDVEARVRQALAYRHGLERAVLGQTLYHGQLVTTVESVAGVANARVRILPGTIHGASNPPDLRQSASGVIRSIHPRAQQMILLDASVQAPSIQAEAFVL